MSISSGRSSNASTPTCECYPMAFENDYPFGTIKRKPCLQPKIPLTSTTRNLAKQSDDTLVEIESSSSGEEGSTKNYHYGTLRLRRSLTDEKLKSLIYEKCRSRKDYDSVSGSTCSTTPSSDGNDAVEDEDDDIDLPLPPPPETLSSSLSTLSLISLPPPPDEYLDSPPNRTPQHGSTNVTPTFSPPVSPEALTSRMLVDNAVRIDNYHPTNVNITRDVNCTNGVSHSRVTNGVTNRVTTNVMNGAHATTSPKTTIVNGANGVNDNQKRDKLDNDLGLDELMRLVNELEHWKPGSNAETSRNDNRVPNTSVREERIYDTVHTERRSNKNVNAKETTIVDDKSGQSCKSQPIYQEVYQIPQRVGKAYVNLNEQPPMVVSPPISPTTDLANGKHNRHHQPIPQPKPTIPVAVSKNQFVSNKQSPVPLIPPVPPHHNPTVPPHLNQNLHCKNSPPVINHHQQSQPCNSVNSSQTYTKSPVASSSSPPVVKPPQPVIAASFNNPSPLSQRSPMKGPLPQPPEMFLRDLHRVMEKKWKVAQTLACNQPQPNNDSQVLGFRDPVVHLSSASSSSSFESSSSSNACCDELQQQQLQHQTTQQQHQPIPAAVQASKAPRLPSLLPVIPVMKLRAKKMPPPPPRRSATTQLTEQPEVVNRRINRNIGTIISRERSIC